VAFVSSILKSILWYLAFTWCSTLLALTLDCEQDDIKISNITSSSTRQDIANFYNTIQDIKLYYYFKVNNEKLFDESTHVLDDNNNDPLIQEKNNYRKECLKSKVIAERFLHLFSNKFFDNQEVNFANLDQGDELIWDDDGLTINDSVLIGDNNFFMCLFCIGFNIKYMPEEFNDIISPTDNFNNMQTATSLNSGFNDTFKTNEKVLLDITKTHAKYLNALAKSKCYYNNECMINNLASRYVVEDFIKFYLDYLNLFITKPNETYSPSELRILNQIKMMVNFSVVFTQE
jgi:hypothetical protein